MCAALPRRLAQLRAHVVAAGTGRHVGMEAARMPEIYCGTMTFGWNQASKTVDAAVATSMLQRFLGSGGVQVDTARIYSGGDTEDILGKVLRSGDLGASRYVLATKAHPSQPGGLSKAGIKGQLEASLKALQTDEVDVLYLHQPDPQNDLMESLEFVQELIGSGTIAKYGMSNYSAVEVSRTCEICKGRGWVLPSFFQGLFNPLNRWTEEELLPVLRQNDIAFIAFNPLAAGLLTGKHQAGTEPLDGRFKNNPNYLPRFYTEANFKALDRIRAACSEHNLGMVQATYAWLMRHSCLDGSRGDGILLGASSMEQFEENLSACRSLVDLPPAVVAVFNEAWATTKEGAFPYWRSYSKDHPGREGLHPGASYDAAKKK